MALLIQMSGSLLIKPARKLSELVIDRDKSWATKGMSNVKELTASMERGDILFFDGVQLTRLTPGPVGTMLTTHDFGNDPTWSY